MKRECFRVTRPARGLRHFSSASRSAALLLVPLIQGCNACWITKPADPIETVTLFEVKFHRYFQPGTFSAKLDGQDVTAHFAPAPTQSGKSTMVWNQPFLGGQGPGYIGLPPVYAPSGAQAPPSDQRPPPPWDLPPGERSHKFSVSCDCIPEATCGHGESFPPFVPLTFVVNPSPLDLPPGGAAYNLTLGADRPLHAPVAVTISAQLLGSTSVPANHIRVNGAAPGAPAVVTLVPGGGAVNFYVQATSPGGFWLSLGAPGAQLTSVTGVAH